MTRRGLARGPAFLTAFFAAVTLTAPVAAAPGDLDGGFASGGIFTGSFMTTFPGNEDSHKVAIDSQGRVVVSATLEGQLNGGLPRKIRVLRLTPQGVPDGLFGSGGDLELPFAGDTRSAGLVIDAQDRPVVAGVNTDYPTSKIALMRLTTTGQPDTTFSGDGQTLAGLPGSAIVPRAEGLVIDTDGGLLVAGTGLSAVARTPFVTRFTDTGDADTGYGVGGWRQVGASSNTAPELVAIHALPGGGAVVAGYDYATWMVARLTAGGSLDTQFDGDGIATTNLGKAALDTVSSYGLTVDGQGRPIVVGQFTTGAARWAIARLTSAGAMDATFGTGSPTAGVVLGPALGSRLNDVDLQCDGRLLVTGIGVSADLKRNALALARYTSGGTLDTSFAPLAATPGIATVDEGTGALGSDLALTAGAATVVGFRRADEGAPNGIRDLVIVARLLKDDTCAGGAPPVPAASGPAAPSPPTPAAPAKSSLPAFTSLVALPAAKKCVSRRRFSIRLRVPRDSAVLSAEVKVNGKRVAVRRGARLRSVVNLAELPRGRFRVDIVLKLADGRTVKGSRSYRTCTTRRSVGGRGPRV